MKGRLREQALFFQIQYAQKKNHPTGNIFGNLLPKFARC